ncbi:MAG: RDD family protein [Pseudomonadota bacterium]|nr:RDD family protein [Pseudomonadota bacterium]
MEINKEQLAANFNSKETNELLRIYTNDLTDIAREILHQELLSRGISEEKLQGKFNPAEHKNNSDFKIQGVNATPSERLVARIIDTSILCLLVFIASKNIIPAAIPGVAAALYLLLQDSIFYGKSIGKFIIGITVLKENTNQTCTFWQSIVRNCFLWFLGIIDLLLMMGKKKQRIGDWAARTTVINDKRYKQSKNQ